MELFKLIGRVAVEGTDEAEQDLKDVTEEAEDSSDKIVTAFKKIGSIVATAFAIDKIVEFGKAAVQAAAEVAAEEAAFSQIMGEYTDEAAKKIEKIADATGIVDSRLTPYMTSMSAKFKGLGYDVEDATSYASRGLNLAADAAAFWDKSLDDSMSALNSFLNGSYEGGEAIGLFANDTQLAQYAVKKGLIGETKEWATLEEARKQATRLEYAENMFALSGAVGQAAKEADAYANVQGNLTESWRQFKAVVGEPILENVVIPAMKTLTSVVEKATEAVEKCSEWVSENKDKIETWTGIIIAAGVAVGTFLTYLNWGTIMSTAAAALNLVTLSIKKMNTAIKSNPIGLILSIIAALIAYIWYLYETNEEFRAFVNEMFAELWEKIQVVVNWIKENVVPVIEEVMNWIRDNVLPVVQEVLGWIQDNIVPAVQGIVDWLVEKIGGFWSWLTGVFEGGSGTIGAIWEKIKGFFQTAWDFIASVWEKCQPFFHAIWENVILEVWDLIQQIIGAFKEAWEVIKLIWDYVQPYFAGLWEAIKAVYSIAKEVLGLYFKNAWEVIKLVWNVAVSYFQMVWDGIKAVFSVVKVYLLGFFKTAWEAIKAVWNTVIDYFTLVWAGVKAVFAVVKGVLSGDFSDAWEAIKNVWDKAKDFFNSIWTGIKNVFGSVGTWFSSTFSAAWNAIKRIFSNWGTFFSGLWDKIKNTFSNIGTNISNAIGSSIKSGLNGIISMIEGTINSGINLINGAINLINEIPGVDIGKISKLSLPRLAKGGVVDKATIAQIGEDGAEAVVPLEKNTEWIDKLADRINGGGNSAAYNRIIELLEELRSMKIYLFDDVMVGELLPAIDTGLGDINRSRKRGG